MLSIPILTLYHKVNWLKSDRKGLGKIEKSRWCSGGAVVLWCWKPEGLGSISGWASSSFRLVPEWKKGLGRIEK